MNKKGFSGIILVVLILVVLLCLFFIRVPYDTFPSNTPNAACVNGELIIKSSGNPYADIMVSSTASISELSNSFGCAISAGQEVSDITSQIECINSVPTVICKTQLYKAILMGRIKFVSKDSITEPKLQFNVKNYNFTEQEFSIENFCKKEVCENGQRASGTNNARTSGWVDCSCVINEGSYAEGTFIVEDFYIDTTSGERITLEEIGRRNNIQLQNQLEEWRKNKPSVEEVTKCINDNFVYHPQYTPDMNKCSNFDIATFKNKCNVKEFDEQSNEFHVYYSTYGTGDKKIVLVSFLSFSSSATVTSVRLGSEELCR